MRLRISTASAKWADLHLWPDVPEVRIDGSIRRDKLIPWTYLAKRTFANLHHLHLVNVKSRLFYRTPGVSLFLSKVLPIVRSVRLLDKYPRSAGILPLSAAQPLSLIDPSRIEVIDIDLRCLTHLLPVLRQPLPNLTIFSVVTDDAQLTKASLEALSRNAISLRSLSFGVYYCCSPEKIAESFGSRLWFLRRIVTGAIGKTLKRLNFSVPYDNFGTHSPDFLQPYGSSWASSGTPTQVLERRFGRGLDCMRFGGDSFFTFSVKNSLAPLAPDQFPLCHVSSSVDEICEDLAKCFRCRIAALLPLAARRQYFDMAVAQIKGILCKTDFQSSWSLSHAIVQIACAIDDDSCPEFAGTLSEIQYLLRFVTFPLHSLAMAYSNFGRYPVSFSSLLQDHDWQQSVGVDINAATPKCEAIPFMLTGSYFRSAPMSVLQAIWAHPNFDVRKANARGEYYLDLFRNEIALERGNLQLAIITFLETVPQLSEPIPGLASFAVEYLTRGYNLAYLARFAGLSNLISDPAFWRLLLHFDSAVHLRTLRKFLDEHIATDRPFREELARGVLNGFQTIVRGRSLLIPCFQRLATVFPELIPLWIESLADLDQSSEHHIALREALAPYS